MHFAVKQRCCVYFEKLAAALGFYTDLSTVSVSSSILTKFCFEWLARFVFITFLSSESLTDLPLIQSKNAVIYNSSLKCIAYFFGILEQQFIAGSSCTFYVMHDFCNFDTACFVFVFLC